MLQHKYRTMSSDEAAHPLQGDNNDNSNHNTNYLEGHVNRVDTASPTETAEQPAAPERRTTTTPTPTPTPTDGTTRTVRGVVRNHTEQQQDASSGVLLGARTNEIRVRRGENVSIRVQLDGRGNRRLVVQTPDGRTIIPTTVRPSMETERNRPDSHVPPNNNNHNNTSAHQVVGGAPAATPTAENVSNNPLPTPQRTMAPSSTSVNPNQTATNNNNNNNNNNNTNGANQQRTGTVTETMTARAALEQLRQRMLREAVPVRRPTSPSGENPIRLVNLRRTAAATATAANNPPFVTIGTLNHPRPLTAPIRLPPLTAQPLPYQSLRQGQEQTDNNNESKLSRAQEERYKCPICFGILLIPSSCGSCSSHFCYACLRQVCESAPANTEPRCPTCRSSLDMEEVVPNIALHHEIMRFLDQNKATCSYQGCQHECSPLKISEHEATCGYCRLRCKYASMGCSWTGLRKDLADHEANGCAYAPIDNLVQQFRTFRAEQQHQVLHLQHRNAGTTGMMEIQTRLIRGLYPKPCNPFDFLSCVYTAVCTPTSFLVSGDRFQFFQPPEARGLVTNLLFLLPFLVHTIRVAKMGNYMLLYHVLLKAKNDDDSREQLVATKKVLLSMAVTLMAVQVATLLVSDLMSSLRWTKYRVPCLGELETVRYATTILLWGFCMLLVKFDGITILSAMVWVWTCVSSCCFGSIVTTVLTVCRNGNNNNNNSPTPQDIVTMSRIPSVVCIGLCCGVGTGLVGGVLPVMDAAMLLRFLGTKMRLTSLMPLYLIHEDWVDLCNGLWGLGFRVAVQAVLMLDDNDDDDDNGWSLENWAEQVVLAFGWLVLTGWLVHGCLYVGTKVGVTIVNMARPLALLQQQQQHPVMDVSSLGLFCTVAWITMLGAIAQS